jgi:hypothetical protein
MVWRKTVKEQEIRGRMCVSGDRSKFWLTPKHLQVTTVKKFIE